MSFADGKEWTLEPGNSIDIYWFGSFYPGIVVMVPDSWHPAHEHKLGYTTTWTQKTASETRYAVRITNLGGDTAHFQMRWVFLQ